MYIHDLNPVLFNFTFLEIRWYSLAYIFGILIGWWIAKKIIIFKIKNKIITFDIKLFFLDIVACVAPIGIFLGRIANFINSELYGKPSNFFWSVIFPKIDMVGRHPSQLYEAFLEGFILFFILIITILKKNIRVGVCSSLFMILYGIFRIFAEQFREPDVQIGHLFNLYSMGSVLSFIMLLAGLFIFVKIKSYETFK